VKSAGKKGEWDGVKIVAQNRSASYNYTLLDKFEAGMVLVGTEVKALREGKGGLREAYADVKGGEVWLINCHIPEYQPGGFRNHDPLRRRKLLLNRREIESS
jgi:SsrA-binding protein